MAMIITPTRKKTPTAALEIIHDFLPIELTLQKTALRPRTHGVKKVPESHKFDSNLAQNPLF